METLTHADSESFYSRKDVRKKEPSQFYKEEIASIDKTDTAGEIVLKPNQTYIRD